MTKINGQELITTDPEPCGFQEAVGQLFDAALDRFMTSRGHPPAAESWRCQSRLHFNRRNQKLLTMRKRWQLETGEDDDETEEEEL